MKQSAKKARVGIDFLSGVEHGEKHLPFEAMMRLADACKVKPAAFWRWSEPQTTEEWRHMISKWLDGLRRTAPQVLQNPNRTEDRGQGQTMRRRKDPPGYPGDAYITRRFYEMKEVLRESAGITCEELEKAILVGQEKALPDSAAMLRAMGIRFRAVREEQNLTRIELADLSNVPAREIGRIERGSSEFNWATWFAFAWR